MKRIIAFLLTTSVLFCTGCSKKSGNRRTEEVISAGYDMYRVFDTGSSIVYPDYYGGRFFSEDGKKLFIYVTSAYDSELDFLTEKYDCVEFIEVEHGMNELESLLYQYKAEIENSFSEIDYVQTVTDEDNNCITVQLHSEILENYDIMDRLRDHFKGRPVKFGHLPYSVAL